MVSHSRPPPYSDFPSSAPPRASSVTSRASTTRRHRHARTHHGGSSAHAPQNEFPVFSHTGDVEILVTSANGRKEQRYLLHMLILSQCSAFFQAGTRAEWDRPALEDARTRAEWDRPALEDGRTTGSLARIGENEAIRSVASTSRSASLEHDRRRWKYVLDWGNTDEGDEPMLVQREASISLFGDGLSERPPPVRNKPAASNTAFFRSMANFSALNLNTQASSRERADPSDDTLKDYDNLFRIFYNHHAVLDQVNIAVAYAECKALLHLADMYDALEVVGPRIDHHLLRFGARLLKQIAKYPPSYLKLAYLARSKGIYSEALIHVVGQWPAAAPQLRGQIDQSVLELIEDKADELEELKAKVEAKFWRLTLTTSRGERVTPSNAFLDWLAMSLFRHWLAENTTPPPPPILKDPSRPPTTATPRVSTRSTSYPAPPPNPARVYRLLASPTPGAYLPHDELKRFLKLQPDLYTRDNLRRFERRMDEMKRLAQDVVRPLTKNFLQLDLLALGPAALPYLTCVRVDGADVGWDD